MNHLPSSVNFREDINGLRAWAVVAVLLFHFKLFGITGGFVGVDIFFVISGFLMTAIIAKGLERGDFSLLKFYIARARRILPALIMVIVALLALGWFWLTDPDYTELGHQSSYALVFISNVYFWRKTGYFDTEAHEKWLLHTWSLSVEWQFYLAFPVFLSLLWKFRPDLKTMALGLLLVFIASLALSGLSNSSKSFYSLSTRGWELSAGGLVYLSARFQVLSSKLKIFLHWLGWVLLVSAITLISNDGDWPGLSALLPVSAAVMLILSQQSNSILFSSHIAQWLGDRSYSLYLWHWPLVVSLYFTGLSSQWAWVLSAIVMSLLLAHLSYQLIEVPTRQYLSDKSLRQEIIIIMVIATVTLIAALGVKKYDFNRPLPPEIEISANEASNKDPRLNECFKYANEQGSPGCLYGSSEVGALLVGDSHASSVATAFGASANKFNKGIIQLSYSGCYPLANAKKIKPKAGKSNAQCIDLNRSSIKKINTFKQDIPVIILSRINAAIWGKNESGEKNSPRVFFSKIYRDGNNPVFQQEFKSALKRWACNIAEKRTVYLARPIPEMGVNVPDTLSRNILFGRANEDIKIPLKAYHLRNRFVWNAQDEAAQECGIKTLNPLPYLCDKQYCYGSKDGRPLYFDDDHLSEYGNKLLIPMFNSVFKSTVHTD